MSEKLQAEAGNVFIEKDGNRYTVFVTVNNWCHPIVFEYGTQGWLWAEHLRRRINGED